jgi:hypothetical protein
MHALTTFWATTLLRILPALIDSLQIYSIQFVWHKSTSIASPKTEQTALVFARSLDKRSMQ